MGGCNGDYVKIINEILGECVTDTRQIVSAFMGIASICFWIPAQFPQLYNNFKNGNADCLALVFLLQWLFGDTLNLLGCILTPQLPTQTAQAVYFVCIDAILFSQYAYYTVVNRNKKKSQADAEESLLKGNDGSVNPGDDAASYGSNGSAQKKMAYVMLLALVVAGFGARYVGNEMLFVDAGVDAQIDTVAAVAAAAGPGRVLLATPSNSSSDSGSSSSSSNSTADGGFTCEDDTTEAQKIIGTVIAWGSATFYLGSRLPQVWKNFRRGSTEGLAPVMFICAVLGNCTYAASVFMYNSEWEPKENLALNICTSSGLKPKLPYLIGSVGTVCFDFTILSQFLWYRGKTPKIADE